MIRLTRKVFNDMAIGMIGLGLLMGVVFPFFVAAMGVPDDHVLKPLFFVACMTAGFIVGGVNIAIARMIVGSRLHLLASHMRLVENNLREIARTGNMEFCTPEACAIIVDSEDELGESARAFNYLIEALASAHRTNAAVHSFSEMLAGQLELDVLADQALQQLLLHTGAVAGSILIAIDGEMKVAASYGIRSANSMISSDHLHHALRTGTRLCVQMPEDIILEGVLADFLPRQILVDPFHYKQIPMGAIILATAATFPEEVLNRIDSFHNGLSLAFNNALTHDRLQKLAALDSLTGIYNRRFGMARLHEEFVRARRAKTPIGVMMCDIDHFKEVNDRHGHLMGDRVLIKIAQVARSTMREGDVLVRYGGEEFLAILPAASEENMQAAGERLRCAVEETVIGSEKLAIRVTISIGVTSYPELAAESEQELISQADAALYSAKNSGRNRVVCL
jgi:diguanylate cyclase (GGDEF)-like protein